MELRPNGNLVHDGILIGKVEDDKRITLNAGWCAAAGVDITVQGNPDVESRRVVFSRKADEHTTTTAPGEPGETITL